MSFLKNVFKSNNNLKEEATTKVQWKPITSIAELDALSEASQSETVLIFKHSTRCGISKMVLRQFEKALNAADEKVTVHYLDLLNYRDISDEIAAKFQVFHQSPQLLVLKNGVAVADASHYSILELNY